MVNEKLKNIFILERLLFIFKGAEIFGAEILYLFKHIH